MFVGHFCPPDTDPGTPLNPDPIRIRPRIRIHSTAYVLKIVCCVTRTSWRCWRYPWCRCRLCCPGEYPGSPAGPDPWMSISRQVTYLGYLVVDLRWSRWVLSGDVVGQCCLPPLVPLISLESLLSGCKHSVSVPFVSIFESNHRHWVFNIMRCTVPTVHNSLGVKIPPYVQS
jgi:hypothetical protein